MLAIINAQIMTITQGTIEQGTILIKDGKIHAIETGAPELPEGTEILDAKGKVVTPGLIEVHGHLGICEEGIGWEGEDVNEMTDPSTPYVRAVDAINPFDMGFEDARKGGVTSAHSMPGSANVIGGETVVIKTAGTIIEEMILNPLAGVKVAFGENPKRVYGEKKQLPSTRMGTAAVLRRELTKAQAYMDKIILGEQDPDKKPDRDLGLDALVKVLKREVPLRAHAHRADDIVTAIRIAEEFNVEITIEHCTEGHKIVDFLKKKNVKVAVGPTLSSRSKVELQDLGFSTVDILNKEGLQVSILTDHPVIPIQYLPICAALATREGLSEEDALRAITINPAKHLGVDHQVGSLEIGKDADIVIWSGHPFDFRTNVEFTIIDGKIVYKK
ncbi:amidohydrolase [Desulfuribacillus stibiiarsenatis]|uniref:Amidohydrolase n=1 Tax=Desulfuribacillus stibiiarsenatis TaxID=1390249 RepID=A0A1E5L474_9FIRM|nr:amidohydrolase [Desulfuribacillus stibiiarsenatis]OEH84940.1 amidohydrolase [Desulfuribacillus stibiiarsenatis]